MVNDVGKWWLMTGWWFGTFFMFPIYWECHHPNWPSPSFFRVVGWNHQPEKISMFRSNQPSTQPLPSGKHTKNYGKSPILMGKSTISMAIFNSYLMVTSWMISTWMVVKPSVRLSKVAWWSPKEYIHQCSRFLVGYYPIYIYIHVISFHYWWL